jgi:tryptophanyl-tRNA synthetase
MKRVFSGSRATGRLHLGNYLGAVKGYIELQNDPDLECIYMVMDLHTITTPYDKQSLADSTRNIIIDYLAAGLDPQKAIISAQSLVPQHTYLSYLFSSVMSIARMQHLPTYKDKVRQYPDHVTLALLNYPVLMAADILVYQAELVPTGIDQEPHLEIAREIARKMNEAYGLTLPEPKRFATKGEYVGSIKGEGKMSKSVEGSYINLTDDLETIKSRLASAPTDSGQGSVVPEKGGVANLLTFVELFQGREQRQAYEQQYVSSGLRYGDLKTNLAQAIFDELQPIQDKHRYYTQNYKLVDDIITDGASKAREIASNTLEVTKSAMGFI